MRVRAEKLGTHSSRTTLPKDMPPQLMPPMRLPARDSRRFRLTLSRFWLLVEMGRGPALTKESWRERPMEVSRAMLGSVGRIYLCVCSVSGAGRCRLQGRFGFDESGGSLSG